MQKTSFFIEFIGEGTNTYNVYIYYYFIVFVDSRLLFDNDLCKNIIFCSVKSKKAYEFLHFCILNIPGTSWVFGDIKKFQAT